MTGQSGMGHVMTTRDGHGGEGGETKKGINQDTWSHFLVADCTINHHHYH